MGNWKGNVEIKMHAIIKKKLLLAIKKDFSKIQEELQTLNAIQNINEKDWQRRVELNQKN